MASMPSDRQFDLVVVGGSPLDILLDYRDPVCRPGGAMYSALAATALGSRVAVVSETGEDKIGGYLGALEGLGIDLRGVEALPGTGLRYEIYNSDEIVPQIVSPLGWHLRPRRSDAFPNDYRSAGALLMYPYQRSLLGQLASGIRTNGGKIFFDLQHDIGSLDEWADILSLCDVVFASHNELLRITSVDTLDDAVQRLLEKGPELVIVKYGLGGSAAFSARGIEARIPAFLAAFRCTIGAGDTYNAAFAVRYSEHPDPQEAGEHAALAAAVFVEQVHFEQCVGALSSLSPDEDRRRRVAVYVPPDVANNIRIYLAGHFLSAPMRRWVDYMTLSLESKGFSVFSPYRDAGLLEPKADLSQRINTFCADLRAIRESSALLALLDGLGHGGTAWEIGYAYSLSIPILGLLTDNRRSLSNMVEQSCIVLVDSHRDLINSLYEMVSRGDIAGARNG